MTSFIDVVLGDSEKAEIEAAVNRMILGTMISRAWHRDHDAIARGDVDGPYDAYEQDYEPSSRTSYAEIVTYG